MAASSKTKKQASIVASLTLWYIGLTIVNIGVFWVGAGSNQMRLISEKATITARGVAFEVIRRVQPYIDSAQQAKNPIAQFKASAPQFQALLQKGNPKELLTSYRILSTQAELIYSWPEQTAKPADLSSSEILDSLKAIQLKEVKNEPFIGVPDLGRKEIDIFVPLTLGKASDLILATRLPMQDIQQEISSLIRLGIGMVVLLLIMQTGMGLLIYRKFVRPIQHVSDAALRLSAGNYDQVENKRSKADEINQLIESFNSMSRDLKKNRDIMQLELDIAKKIQSSILPRILKIGAITAEIHYNPLQVVSGDYYDLLDLPDGSVAVFIGDASGHGVPAAFITVMAKVYFTSLVEKVESPAQLLSTMNQRMAEYFSGAGLYLTAFYLRIYPSGRAVYCNAQHPDPVILRKDGKTELLKPTGFYVGMLKKVFREYKDEEITLLAGDRIVLYTDGFTEAENAENIQFSSERLIAGMEAKRGKSSRAIIDELVHEVAQHQGGRARDDDETLIVIEIGDLAPAEVAPEETHSRPPAERGPEQLEFEKDPEFAAARNAMASSPNADLSFGQWLKKAEKALKDKKLYEALAELVSMNSRYPQDSGIMFHLAVALYGLKYYKDAEVFLSQCVERDPQFADAYWLRSLSAMKCGDDAAALEHITRALAEKPDEQRYLKVMQTLTGGVA